MSVHVSAQPRVITPLCHTARRDGRRHFTGGTLFVQAMTERLREIYIDFARATAR
jgi:hypothetical protein